MPGETDLDRSLRRLAPQLRVHPSLHDSEESLRLVRPLLLRFGLEPWRLALVRFEVVFAPLSPARRHLHRLLRPASLRRIFRALVERHDDVRAEPDLGFNRLLRGEEVPRAVQVRLECHTLLGHFPQLTQAEYLEPAGVGQDGLVPGHEPLYSAEFPDLFDTGP